MNDVRLLIATASSVSDFASIEEREYLLNRSIDANIAVNDFIHGKIDVDTFLDIIEDVGVDIDDYLGLVEDNLIANEILR